MKHRSTYRGGPLSETKESHWDGCVDVFGGRWRCSDCWGLLFASDPRPETQPRYSCRISGVFARRAQLDLEIVPQAKLKTTTVQCSTLGSLVQINSILSMSPLDIITSYPLCGYRMPKGLVGILLSSMQCLRSNVIRDFRSQSYEMGSHGMLSRVLTTTESHYYHPTAVLRSLRNRESWLSQVFLLVAEFDSQTTWSISGTTWSHMSSVACLQHSIACHDSEVCSLRASLWSTEHASEHLLQIRLPFHNLS